MVSSGRSTRKRGHPNLGRRVRGEASDQASVAARDIVCLKNGWSVNDGRASLQSRPVLDGLGQVSGLDVIDSGQVGDAAG